MFKRVLTAFLGTRHEREKKRLQPIIEAIHAQNVVSGYADGTFHPGNDATRSQLSKMLSTAFHLPNGLGGTATPVADATGTVTATAVTATATPLTRR